MCCGKKKKKTPSYITTAEGLCSIPGWKIKIPQAVHCGKKKKKGTGSICMNINVF